MSHSAGRLRRILLLYLVVLGSMPYLDGLTHPHAPEGFHPRYNVQLGWKLAHAIPALGGIGIALSLMNRSPMAAFPAVAILSLQIALGIADYRRIGFNDALPRNFSIADYLLAGVGLAAPFAIYGWRRWSRDRTIRHCGS